MNEMRAVVEAYERAMRDGVETALATVVCVEGSTYRRPGARMLIRADGEMTGSLSGGCLERDVFERARAVMNTRQPVVVRYDTGSTADIVWGLGLGCNGIVHVLIEPLDSIAMPLHFKLLADCMTGQEPCVIATVFSVRQLPSLATHTNSLGISAGSRLLLTNKSALVEFNHEEFAYALTQDAQEVLNNNESSIKAYELAEGRVEVFIEIIEPPVPVIIFGAGADAMPVLEFAQKLGWHVTVVDTQARAASRERFAAADAVFLCRPEDVRTQVPLSQRTMAIVMTHNYEHDFELFRTLQLSSVHYIGCLGPKRRTEQIISEAGSVITNVERRRLHFPVGLDLGAETPEEIALSIVAEMSAVLAGHEGGFLKNRAAPIHATSFKRQHGGTPTDSEIASEAETHEGVGA